MGLAHVWRRQRLAFTHGTRGPRNALGHAGHRRVRHVLLVGGDHGGRQCLAAPRQFEGLIVHGPASGALEDRSCAVDLAEPQIGLGQDQVGLATYPLGPQTVEPRRDTGVL